MELKPGYKQTEVGVIPEDWNVKQFGELFTFSGGYAASRAQLSNDGHCYLHYGDIHGSLKTTVDTALDYLNIPKLAISLNHVPKDSLLENGDVVFVDASEDDEGTSKHIVVVNTDSLPFISGLHTIVAKTRADDLALNYRRYCFKTHAIRRQFMFYAVGTKVSGISKSNIRKLLLPLPPPQEQRAIAIVLSDVDALLEGLDRLIAKKRDLKQAAMQQLLTGNKRLPGFKGKWEVRTFDDVLLRVNSKAHQIQTSDYHSTGRYPVVDQGKELVIGYSDRETQCFQCPEGGVIVFGDHTCIVKFIDFDFLVGADGTQLLRGKSGQNTRYHAFHLQYRGVEPTGYNRHFKFLKEREYIVPSFCEQTAIAAVLTDMDAEITALEQRLNKTRDLKQAMMQELLTGKTRLVSLVGCNV